MIEVLLSVVKRLTKEDCEYFSDHFGKMEGEETPNCLVIAWDTFTFQFLCQFKFNDTCIYQGSLDERYIEILKSGGDLELGVTVSLFDNPRICAHVSTEPITQLRFFRRCISIDGEIIMVQDEDYHRYNQYLVEVLRKAVKAAINSNYERYYKRK